MNSLVNYGSIKSPIQPTNERTPSGPFDLTKTYNTKILSPEYYRNNGRVDIYTESPDAVIKMHERIAIRNKSIDYQEALTGIWEDNQLSTVYFSAGNIQILQNGIRAGVYKKSQQTINVPPQNMDALSIIMRSIYLQYAQHDLYDIRAEVERLNQKVLHYCIDNVYSSAMAYNAYVRDASTLVQPLERPLNHDRDYKQLELRPSWQ